MYEANSDRYSSLPFARSGNSGLKLPKLSLGLWHNFGGDELSDHMRQMLRNAFDNGIFHFDLANNYGPPAGSSETNFGTMMAGDFKPYRDELIVSTKAGYHMWDGPHGEWGSRKYLLASLDQSLNRMGLDYVDIFYSHRFDPDTPLEETMGALDTAVRSGRALYVGISSYGPEKTREAAAILRDLGTPCVIHQPSYSMLNRWVEDGLLDGQEDTNRNGRRDEGETVSDVANGDFNLDSIVDLEDLILLLKTLTDYPMATLINVRADTDGNHKLDMVDGLFILKKID